MSIAAEILQAHLLIERERETAQITRVLREASSNIGQLLFVESHAGMGKTALLRCAREQARADGLQVFASAASESETEYPFGTVLSLFSTHLRALDPASRDLAFAGRARACRPLFEHACPNATAEDDAAQFAIVDSLYWLVANVSATAPVTIVVDDVQRVDMPTLRFLDYLARRSDTLPIAVVVALTRGEPRSSQPLITSLMAAASAHLNLRPLTNAGIEAVLRTTADALPSIASVAPALAEVTGGSPYLAVELARKLVAGPSPAHGSVLEGIDTLVPSTVRHQIMVRLNRLGEKPVAIAQACAVLDERATLGLAASLAGESLQNAADATDRLVESNLLAVQGDGLTFPQPLVRLAIYEAMPPGKRALAHAAAATRLHQLGDCSDAVAHHLLKGAPVTEVWAVDALESGAISAARKGSPATAAQYLRRAISTGIPQRRRSALLRDLGLLEAASGETESALGRLESAARLMDDPAERAQCLYALGLTLYRDGRYANAARAFRQSAQIAERADGELALSASGAWIFTSLYLAGVPPTASARLDELSARVSQSGTLSAAAKSVLAVAALRCSMTAPPGDLGAKMACDALEGGALYRDQASDCVAATWAILALIHVGRVDEAGEGVEDVLADARRHGNVLAVAEASLLRSLVHRLRGDIAKAYDDARAAVEGVENGWFGLAPLAFGVLAQCHLERDEIDAAEAVLNAAEAILDSDRPQARGLTSWIEMSRGLVFYRRGDMQSALSNFLAAGGTLTVFGTTNPSVMRWRTMAGLAAKALGDLELATEHINHGLRLAQAFGIKQEVGAALRAKAALTTGSERRRLLKQSLTTLEDSGNALDLAETLCELGGEVRRSGQRVRSRELLTRAMDIAYRNGALALVKRAREELLASGARPRRPVTTGVGSLTPTERRVAGLAAKGLTNPEIAERLYLAKSTVAWHLRHVFLKLDIDSRSDLSRVYGLDRELTLA